MLFGEMAKRLVRWGRLSIIDADGERHEVGRDGPQATIRLHERTLHRRLALNPTGTGGYVLDGYGGLHPFGVGAASPPSTPGGAAYWSGWDIARDLVVTATGQSERRR